VTTTASLSPVVKYHGLGHRHLEPHRLLMRPLLNGATLGGLAMQADDFASLAREYDSLLRGAQNLKPHEFLLACAKLLPRIYAAGISLPNAEPDDTEPAPSAHSPALPSLGRFDVYSEVFDPFVHEDPVMSALSSDLSEIYSDLVGPLQDFDVGRVANAIRSWRFNICGHCGEHLVDALRAIHRAIFDHMPDDYVAAVDGKKSPPI